MASKGTKGNKHKFRGRNVGPAQNHYWAVGRLQTRKVKNLMRCCGMTHDAATAHWINTRQYRRMRTGLAPSVLGRLPTVPARRHEGPES